MSAKKFSFSACLFSGHEGGNRGAALKSVNLSLRREKRSFLPEARGGSAEQAEGGELAAEELPELRGDYPALFMMNTGTTRVGYPCVGSWVNYGLGSENDSLPSFVVMSDPLNRGLPKGSAANWGPGFLPSVYQGTWLKPSGAPIDNLAVPASLTPLRQRAQLELHATILAAAGLDHERLVDQAVNPASLCQVMAFSSMATSVTCSGLAMRLVSASGS